ncbi:dTMP kinase [bacterium c-19]|nr:dTMP kinase [bacterium c-19]
MHKGLFITFEGNDGSGKTTISKKVYEALLEKSYPVIYTREPGGIEIAEKIRTIILDPNHTAMDARCEALLYAASRRQHLIEKVLPALETGKIVLCDRFIDSSLAYQGIGRGIGIDEVLKINQFAIESYMPDATFFLRVSLETGMQRVNARGNLDRMDLEANDFHCRVSEGYEKVKEMFAERMIEIDAEADIETVFRETLVKCEELINAHE